MKPCAVYCRLDFLTNECILLPVLTSQKLYRLVRRNGFMKPVHWVGNVPNVITLSRRDNVTRPNSRRLLIGHNVTL